MKLVDKKIVEALKSGASIHRVGWTEDNFVRLASDMLLVYESRWGDCLETVSGFTDIIADDWEVMK